MSTVCKKFLDTLKMIDITHYNKMKNLDKCTCKSVCNFRYNNNHFYEVEKIVPRHLRHKHNNNNNNNNNNNEDK